MKRSVLILLMMIMTFSDKNNICMKMENVAEDNRIDGNTNDADMIGDNWNNGDSNDEDLTDEIGKYFDLGEVNRYLEEQNVSIDFEEIVRDFSKGNIENGASLFYELLKQHLILEISLNQNVIRKIIILAFVTAIFSNFAAVFKSSQVSEMGFLICYAAVITYLMSSFSLLVYMAFQVTKTITDYMKALIPVYAVSIGVCDGQTNAVSFYEMALLMIGMVDVIALKIIIPATEIYVGIGMINHLGARDYLSKTCELIKKGVDFGVKGLMTIVLGLNVIQKMFSPVSGGIARTAAKSMLNTASGISVAGNGVAELLYGTGKIMKSTIGGAGVVAICVIMAVPLIKMIILILSYYLTNAVIQPVSDERIVKCLACVAEGASMTLKTVFSVMVMFVITITIICIS